MELSKLILTTEKGDTFRLENDYIYQVDDLIIKVPKGFESDLASTPQIFKNILNSYGKNYTRAAIVHDYLYSKNCTLNISRKKADEIFLAIMKERGVGVFKRNLMYYSVRLFGGLHFKK